MMEKLPFSACTNEMLPRRLVCRTSDDNSEHISRLGFYDGTHRCQEKYLWESALGAHIEVQ